MTRHRTSDAHDVGGHFRAAGAVTTRDFGKRLRDPFDIQCSGDGFAQRDARVATPAPRIPSSKRGTNSIPNRLPASRLTAKRPTANPHGPDGRATAR